MTVPAVSSRNRRCRCGCENPVKPGRRYRAGHDRRHVEALVARHRQATTAAAREAVVTLADVTLTRALFGEFNRRVTS